MIYTAQKPPQTQTFPICKAFLVTRDLDLLLNLQDLSCNPFSLDLGPPSTSNILVCTFSANGKTYTLKAGYVAVKLPTGDFEIFQTQAAFLAVYNVL